MSEDIKVEENKPETKVEDGESPKESIETPEENKEETEAKINGEEDNKNEGDAKKIPEDKKVEDKPEEESLENDVKEVNEEVDETKAEERVEKPEDDVAIEYEQKEEIVLEKEEEKPKEQSLDDVNSFKPRNIKQDGRTEQEISDGVIQRYKEREKLDSEIVDFISLFNSSKFKNVTLIFGKSIKIRCHSCVLSQSPYLEEKMKSITTGQDNEIYVQDDIPFRVEDIKFITQWFYGKSPETSNVDWDNLILLSKKFKMNSLLHYLFTISERTPTEDDKKYYLSNVSREYDAEENIIVHVCTKLFKQTQFDYHNKKYSEIYTDTNFVLISSDWQDFHAHKEVLCIRSEYFQKLLLKDLNMEDFRLHARGKVIELLLHYYYLLELPNDFERYSIRDFLECHNWAQEKEEQEIVDLCKKKILSILTEENVKEVVFKFRKLLEKNQNLREVIYSSFPSVCVKLGELKSLQKNNNKGLHEGVDIFIMKMKRKRKMKEKLIDELKEKKEDLTKKKEDLGRKVDEFESMIIKEHEKNAELQFKIAKSQNPNKLKSIIARKEKELEGADDAKKGDITKEIDEAKKKIENLVQIEAKYTEELKKNENQVLKLFNEKQNILEEMYEIDLELSKIDRDLNDLEDIRISLE